MPTYSDLPLDVQSMISIQCNSYLRSSPIWLKTLPSLRVVNEPDHVIQRDLHMYPQIDGHYLTMKMVEYRVICDISEGGGYVTDGWIEEYQK